MDVAGLQKLTLLDYPGKVACTVFLPGCNLRCPFCHNASLVLPDRRPPETMSQAQLLDFLQTRVRKLDGVCITGGEPTIHRDLPELVRAVRDLGFSVKLDTNGTNPQMLQSLLEEGLLDYVAMDIKNSPQHYAPICGGVPVLSQVQESVELLKHSAIDYEFRTTVLHPWHTVEDLRSIARWLQGARAYYLQEFVDSGDLIGGGSACSPEEMQQLLQAVQEYLPCAQLRGL